MGRYHLDVYKRQEKSREEIVKEFRELMDHAHTYGMEVILDVARCV